MMNKYPRKSEDMGISPVIFVFMQPVKKAELEQMVVVEVQRKDCSKGLLSLETCPAVGISNSRRNSGLLQTTTAKI